MAVQEFVANEEKIFYPAARSEAEDTTDEVLEAFEEHHVVKWVLSELQGLDSDAERFDAKITVFVRHHSKRKRVSSSRKSVPNLGANAWMKLGWNSKKQRKRPFANCAQRKLAGIIELALLERVVYGDEAIIDVNFFSRLIGLTCFGDEGE